MPVKWKSQKVMASFKTQSTPSNGFKAFKVSNFMLSISRQTNCSLFIKGIGFNKLIWFWLYKTRRQSSIGRMMSDISLQSCQWLQLTTCPWAFYCRT